MSGGRADSSESACPLLAALQTVLPEFAPQWHEGRIDNSLALIESDAFTQEQFEALLDSNKRLRNAGRRATNARCIDAALHVYQTAAEYHRGLRARLCIAGYVHFAERVGRQGAKKGSIIQTGRFKATVEAIKTMQAKEKPPPDPGSYFFKVLDNTHFTSMEGLTENWQKCRAAHTSTTGKLSAKTLLTVDKAARIVAECKKMMWKAASIVKREEGITTQPKDGEVPVKIWPMARLPAPRDDDDDDGDDGGDQTDQIKTGIVVDGIVVVDIVVDGIVVVGIVVVGVVVGGIVVGGIVVVGIVVVGIVVGGIVVDGIVVDGIVAPGRGGVRFVCVCVCMCMHA